MSEPQQLANLTWVDAAAVLAQRPVGLLPIGAVEAHGPHLPLDTDIIIANATALAAAEKLVSQGTPALVLPSLCFTVSFAGTSFAGTSPVDAEAFRAYLSSILTHLASAGYRAIICCNAHLEPAHVEAVQRACRGVESASDIPVRSPDQRSPDLAARLSSEFQAGARHAGSYETSIVMAAKPESVRMERLAELEPVWIDLPARLREGARTFAEAGAVQGYFGNPGVASAEEGRRLLDVLADLVLEACREAGVTSTIRG